ncbi:MAG: hypothetical protein U0T75_01400 [Chitinophagales bacterium]
MFLKKTYRYLVYLSLAFLVYKLAKTDYLAVPHIYNWTALIISILILSIANLISAFLWFRVLRETGSGVAFLHCLASQGLTIFAKYIPGFIWTVAGNVSYISEKFKYNNVNLIIAALYFQIATVWCALFLGSIGLLFTDTGNNKVLLIISLILLTGTIAGLLLLKPIGHLINSFLRKRNKAPLNIPKTYTYLKLTPLFFLINGVWALAFHFFALSLSTSGVPPFSGLGFDLGIAYGILSVFTPGGIGVREGVVSKYLMDLGVETTSAISTSVSSRLWYLGSEILFFLQGYIALLLLRRKNEKT